MMYALSLSLLAGLCLMSMVLCLILAVLLWKSSTQNRSVLLNLLADQVIESQGLRNQLRSPDLGTLAGLNSLTLPSSEQADEPEAVDMSDLGEAVAHEEWLASQGYSLGDTGGFESAGWSPTVVRREAGEFTAFDAT